jgi:hypothetical protein
MYTINCAASFKPNLATHENFFNADFAKETVASGMRKLPVFSWMRKSEKMFEKFWAKGWLVTADKKFTGGAEAAEREGRNTNFH